MKHLNLPHHLLDALTELLDHHPEGLSEFDLMQQLDRNYPEVYPKPDLRDPILLFQHHFVLMHALYRLQDDWWETGRGVLDISALHIVRRPLVERGTQQLSVDRSLKEYYLDWGNLGKESAESVQSLLDGFWKRLLGEVHAPDALATLGLDKTASAPEIKARYRQLAGEHHPDKGGDPEQFHQIREAYEVLMARIK